jgi:hypothetical protein
MSSIMKKEEEEEEEEGFPFAHEIHRSRIAL